MAELDGIKDGKHVCESMDGKHACDSMPDSCADWPDSNRIDEFKLPFQEAAPPDKVPEDSLTQSTFKDGSADFDDSQVHEIYDNGP